LGKRGVPVFFTGDEAAVRVLVREEAWEIRTQSGVSSP